MKTAVQEVIQIVEMDLSNGVEISMRVFLKMLKYAHKKEIEQIKRSFVAGDERGTKGIPFNAEQYFTQFYINN